MNRFLQTILIPVIAISAFILLDTALPTLPAFLAWVIFFPLRLLLTLSSFLHIQEELRILLVILFGIPALLVYWVGAYRATGAWKSHDTDT